MTKQNRIIERIEAKYNVTMYETYFNGVVFLGFDNNQDGWNRQTFCATVGVKGRLTITYADRIMTDKKHQKCLARLMAYEIGIGNPTIRFSH